MKAEIRNTSVKLIFPNKEIKYIDRFSICPICKSQTEYNTESDYYECSNCNWYDINPPATFNCTWCGEEEVMQFAAFKKNEQICRECQKPTELEM